MSKESNVDINRVLPWPLADVADRNDMPSDVVWRYKAAIDGFLHEKGNEMLPCVAVAVMSALLVTDPAQMLYLGFDSHSSFTYETVGARVWKRVCDELVRDARRKAADEMIGYEARLANGHDDVWAEIPVGRIETIVAQECSREFGSGVEDDFSLIIEMEFGEESGARIPDCPGAAETATMIARTVGSFPFRVLE